MVSSYRASFRCGVFFAGKELKDKPFEKIFILPKRFDINASYYQEDSSLPKQYSSDASCPVKNVYGTVEEPSVHNDTCFNIVSKQCYDKKIKNFLARK